MTREEYLARCKREALLVCDQRDPEMGYLTFAADLHKHPELKNHPALRLGFDFLFHGHLDTPQKMREFIEGFR